jgi:hypothetical protein
MNFKYLYEKIHTLKFNCDITNLFKIKRILFGSGGSNNIILDVRNKNDNKLIVKIIPDFIYVNVREKPNHDQLEIKFYQFFTKKYILTDRSPHIVGIYNHQNCSRIDKLLNNIKPNKKICPSYEDKLTKKLKMTDIDNKLCDLLLRYEMKLIDPIFDVILLEYCDNELSKLIEQHIYIIKNSKPAYVDTNISNFISVLYRILFQIIFTLAIIKEDYPGFSHGDLFVRNILLLKESSYSNNEYVAYYYKQKIFYLSANGQYAKINDFGLSIIVDELEPNTYQFDKQLHKFIHKNPFDEKSDIFNLLHDIYDGQNLGTSSIMVLANELKIPHKKIKYIRDFLGKFIKVDIIDHINNINPELLDQTWDIDQIKVLENTVLTPDRYLTKNHFEIFQELPQDAKIIRHFNFPK